MGAQHQAFLRDLSQPDCDVGELVEDGGEFLPPVQHGPDDVRGHLLDRDDVRVEHLELGEKR